MVMGSALKPSRPWPRDMRAAGKSGAARSFLTPSIASQAASRSTVEVQGGDSLKTKLETLLPETEKVAPRSMLTPLPGGGVL